MEEPIPSKSEILQLSMLLAISKKLDQLLRKRPLTEEIRDFDLKYGPLHDILERRVAEYILQHPATGDPIV